MAERYVPPNKHLSLRMTAMPADTNPNGDIFGGWLVSQMDLAGASVASERAQGRVVTVSIDQLVFHKPVLVGDEVSCYVEIIRTGRTSMTLKIEVWIRRIFSQETLKVTEGMFTFVAVDGDGKPRELPHSI